MTDYISPKQFENSEGRGLAELTTITPALTCGMTA